MAGVRIQHPTARSCRFTVVEDRPYPKPYHCTPPEFGGCGSTHLFKTHHLNVDEVGAVIVGDQLYVKIKHLLTDAGFTETNIVAKPPTLGFGMGPMRIGTGAWGNIPIVRHEGVTRG